MWWIMLIDITNYSTTKKWFYNLLIHGNVQNKYLHVMVGGWCMSYKNKLSGVFLHYYYIQHTVVVIVLVLSNVSQLTFPLPL